MGDNALLGTDGSGSINLSLPLVFYLEQVETLYVRMYVVLLVHSESFVPFSFPSLVPHSGLFPKLGVEIVQSYNGLKLMLGPGPIGSILMMGPGPISP